MWTIQIKLRTCATYSSLAEPHLLIVCEMFSINRRGFTKLPDIVWANESQITKKLRSLSQHLIPLLISHNYFLITVNQKIFVSKNFRVRNFCVKNVWIRGSVRNLKTPIISEQGKRLLLLATTWKIMEDLRWELCIRGHQYNTDQVQGIRRTRFDHILKAFSVGDERF